MINLYSKGFLMKKLWWLLLALVCLPSYASAQRTLDQSVIWKNLINGTTPFTGTSTFDRIRTLGADTNPINLRDFGVACNGLVDDTGAFQAAISSARSLHRPIAATNCIARIDGTLDPAGVTIVGPGQSYSRNSLDPSTWGFVIEANGGNALFAPSAGAFTMEGVVLYDLKQPGTGSAPVVRPPLFEIAGQVTDVTFRDNVVVNAYDLFHISATGVFGDWRVESNRLYAVRYGFDIQGNMPEVTFLSNNIWSPGVWQGATFFSNNAMLTKWSGLNGAVLHINNPTFSVDGIRSSNDFAYSDRSYVFAEAGSLNVSSISNPGFDAMLQPIVVTGTARAILSISGGWSYAVPYNDTVSSAPAFSIGGSGDREITITGHHILAASGGAVYIQDGGAGVFEWRGGDIENWGLGTGTDSVAGLRVQAPQTRIVYEPARMLCGNNQIGGIIADARTLKISTTWEHCVRYLDVQAAPTLLGGVDTSLAVNTANSPGSTNTSSTFGFKGTYDK
jgi:hypothetical protein